MAGLTFEIKNEMAANLKPDGYTDPTITIIHTDPIQLNNEVVDIPVNGNENADPAVGLANVVTALDTDLQANRVPDFGFDLVANTVEFLVRLKTCVVVETAFTDPKNQYTTRTTQYRCSYSIDFEIS